MPPRGILQMSRDDLLDMYYFLIVIFIFLLI